MAANAEPVVANQLPLVFGKPRHRHETTPDHDAGELGPAVAEHLLPYRGMDPVGADQDVAGCGLAICEADRCATLVLVVTHAPIAEPIARTTRTPPRNG